MAQVIKNHSWSVLVGRYLAHRRKLGFGLRGGEALFDFGKFAQRAAPGQPLTVALALEWATSSPVTRTRQAARLSLVRGFAKYCILFDPRTEIPDGHLLGPVCVRLRPHIYTPEQIRLILRRAKSLTTRRSPLHPLTYETLIGLLACTGMRPGEARRLRLGDFDADAGCLRIAPCKFSPQRVIPLHASTVRALQRYQRARRSLFAVGDQLFVGATGRPLQDVVVYRVFARLTAGIPSTGDRQSLRLMDFRHTFASQWIARWSRQSQPVSHYLLRLARFLGHQDFKSTWWYVSSDPKSLQAAAKSFLRFHEQNHSLP